MPSAPSRTRRTTTTSPGSRTRRRRRARRPHRLSGEAPAAIAAFGYPDYSSGIYGVIATTAALEWRDQTGEGQLVDLSQFEATVSLSGRSCSTTNATTPHRRAWATVSPGRPPRACTRARATTGGWRSAPTARTRARPAQVVAGPRGRRAPASPTCRRRVANHDALDDLISAWTRQHTAEEVAAWLQAAGVAAGR